MSTQHIITALYFSSAVASLFFVARYMFTKWWKSSAGRKMMIFHLIMVGFGISSTLFLLYGPDYTGRLPLALVLCLGLNYVNWGWSLELHRAQRGHSTGPKTLVDSQGHSAKSLR